MDDLIGVPSPGGGGGAQPTAPDGAVGGDPRAPVSPLGGGGHGGHKVVDDRQAVGGDALAEL